MDEKVIIKSSNGEALKKIKKGIIIGGIMLVGGFVVYLLLWTILDAVVSNSAARSLTYPFVTIMILGAILMVVCAILYFDTSKCTMTITPTRVYGTAAFGKMVDLPVDSITAVGTAFLNSICVTTPSGSIRFMGIDNKDDIQKEISELLTKRQTRQNTTESIKQEGVSSNADELKKYKELFDSGVITQEEFDAKKKQLLGL